MYVYFVALALSLMLSFLLSRTVIFDGTRSVRSVRRVKSTLTAFLILLPLTLVLLFRWNVGVDSVYGNSYSTAYHLAARGLNLRGFETGYYLFSRFFASLRTPFFWYLFILGLIYMTCTSYGISKLSVSPALSVLSFVLLLTYFDSFSALRQALAQGICVVALGKRLTSDETGNPRRRDALFVLTILLASLFHSIALIYILLFLVCRIRFSRKLLIAITVTLVLLTPVIHIVLERSVNLFTGGQYSSSGFASSYMILSLLIYALCLWRYYDILDINPRATFLINHALCTFILMLNSSALVLPFRFYDALKICYIFTIPYIIKSFKSRPVRNCIAFMLLTVMGVFFVNAMFLQDSAYADYQTVFEDWNYFTNLY